MVDPFEVHSLYYNKDTDPTFQSPDYYSCIKSIFTQIKQAIKDNDGKVIARMDTDIQFFGPCIHEFEEHIKDNDLAFMSEKKDTNKINGGVVIIRCSPLTYNLFETLETSAMGVESSQKQCQQILDKEQIKYSVFSPHKFLSNVNNGEITHSLLLHHAAGLGYVQKYNNLQMVRDQYNSLPPIITSLPVNNSLPVKIKMV